MTNTTTKPNAKAHSLSGDIVQANVDTPIYDGKAIEAILSFQTFQENRALWWETVQRFFSVTWILGQVLYWNWLDNQPWVYLKEDDVERAQTHRRTQTAKRVVDILLNLGPTFIKVGQSLSSRVDLVRKEYIEALAKLQDKVPAFDIAMVRATIKEELGDEPEALFASFDSTPIAAASLGQVHRVTLKTGEEAVIKVQRPYLTKQFEIDLAIVKKIARFLQNRTEIGRQREWVSIVDEFGRTLFEEIDYIAEGRNADKFRQNFAQWTDKVVIPKVYWRYTARRVITLEYCPGIKINNRVAIEAQGHSPKELATTFVRAYFQQLLLDGFFHADPHPGNVVISPEGKVVLYDFGMVGHIGDDTRIKLVNTFLNIVGRRIDAILQNLIDLEMITAGGDVEEIRQVITWSLENYYDVPYDQLNFEQLAEEMAEVMYYYPFKLPASFTFMFRATMTLEGVAIALYPQVRFMALAVEYAQEFLQKRVLFDSLFSEDSNQNVGKLIKEGLSLLGLEAPNQRTLGTQRVRLVHDEWTPLARYIKAGFLLLGVSQSIIFAAFVAILMYLAPPISGTLWFWVQYGLVFGGFMWLAVWFATVMCMPNRKKPFQFNPPKPQYIKKPH